MTTRERRAAILRVLEGGHQTTHTLIAAHCGSYIAVYDALQYLLGEGAVTRERQPWSKNWWYVLAPKRVPMAVDEEQVRRQRRIDWANARQVALIHDALQMASYDMRRVS